MLPANFGRPKSAVLLTSDSSVKGRHSDIVPCGAYSAFSCCYLPSAVPVSSKRSVSKLRGLKLLRWFMYLTEAPAPSRPHLVGPQASPTRSWMCICILNCEHSLKVWRSPTSLFNPWIYTILRSDQFLELHFLQVVPHHALLLDAEVYNVRPERVFKGHKHRFRHLVTPINGSLCGVSLSSGDRYLIFGQIW